MSFCSQALIGFCKAETGLSKDVGVALSMGQGEPVPIQPWTLPLRTRSLSIPGAAATDVNRCGPLAPAAAPRGCVTAERQPGRGRAMASIRAGLMNL